MLVLARRQSEQIRIGNDITVTILRIKGQTVRVGIDAPREIHVVRSELQARTPVISESLDSLTEGATRQQDESDCPCASESRSAASSFDAADSDLPASAAL